jgi:hypothetical protein
VVDHYTAEAWAHVAKVRDRFAALQLVYDAVIDGFGGLDADMVRGIALRHDWDRNTARLTSSARSPGWASPRTPPSSVSRRPTAARTLKEQAVVGFVDRYNTQWLSGRLDHRTPTDPNGGLPDATMTSVIR